MPGNLDRRKSKRVTMGLAPAIYDRYDKLYSGAKETIIYSIRNQDNTLTVVGKIEITYQDSTRCLEISAERIAI